MSCYKYRNDWNLELAYFDFSGRVKSIERECYDIATGVEDIVLCFTTKTNFRYDIYPAYKANRKKEKTEEAKLLAERVKELKTLVYDRIKPMCKASSKVEADDLVIMYANKGYLISAMDKDVVNQSPTKCFDFKKWAWIDGKSEMEINRAILTQSIAGDSTDNIKGVKGMGEKKAEKFIDELLNQDKSFDDYVNLFETPEDMLLNVQLVNCHQWNGKLKLSTVDDVYNMMIPF